MQRQDGCLAGLTWKTAAAGGRRAELPADCSVGNLWTRDDKRHVTQSVEGVLLGSSAAESGGQSQINSLAESAGSIPSTFWVFFFSLNPATFLEIYLIIL